MNAAEALSAAISIGADVAPVMQTAAKVAPGLGLAAAAWAALWAVRIGRAWIACKRALADIPAVDPMTDLDTHLNQTWARLHNEAREEQP